MFVKLLSLTFELSWNSRIMLSFFSFLSSCFPSGEDRSSVYSPWPSLTFGIGWPGFSESSTHFIDFDTLSLRLSFSPAWILIV